jgi:hypothetical protein
MQETATVIGREARHRLPRLLADLLDDRDVLIGPPRSPACPADLIASDGQGRTWVFQVKTSSRPGQLKHAAEQLRRCTDPDVISVLVVPYMSRAGAETAHGAELNWLDLSGNAHIRAEGLRLLVQGRPNELHSRGRPSSPFAPKSARVTRTMLLDPERWWRQKDLADATELDDGSISRVVRRLDEELLIERSGHRLRPQDPGLLLDAWAPDYRFDGHDILPCHVSGTGMEIARSLSGQLKDLRIHHAFTGLPAAWVMDQFARFRLTTIYIDGDPRSAAAQLDIRQGHKGANVQLVGPNDAGVFSGERAYDDLPCVAPVQVYLDLLHLPERANEAAQHLRGSYLGWQRA